jgi:protein-tyrosine phosphatase
MARRTMLLLGTWLVSCGDPNANPPNPSTGSTAGSKAAPSTARSEPTEGDAGPVPAAVASPQAVPASPDSLCESERIALAKLPNARELGGAPTPTGDSPCGRYLRMAALDGLKQAGCDAFAALGVRTVLDIRTAAERGVAPDSRCVTSATKVVVAPLPAPTSLSPEQYLSVLHTDASMKTIFAVLSDDAAWPVAFHCTYGRDRTGIVSALLLQVQGVDDAYILGDYQRTQDAGLSTAPASLAAVLQALKAEGGAAAHLASIGISPEQLTALR